MSTVPVLVGFVVPSLFLLVMAGIAKLIDPAPTAGALSAAGLPSRRWHVFVLGLAEVFAGIVALATGDLVAMTIAALLYLGFATFVAYALKRNLPIASCGCFGATDTPPSRVHLIVNLVLAGIVASTLLMPMDPLAILVSAPVGESLLVVLYSAIVTYLIYALLAVLPESTTISDRQRTMTPIRLGERR